MFVKSQPLDSDPSPRSSIILDSTLMTSTAPAMNESNLATDLGTGDDSKKMLHPSKESQKDSTLSKNRNQGSPASSFKDVPISTQKGNNKCETDKVATNKETIPPTNITQDFQEVHLHHPFPPYLSPQTGSIYSYNPQHMTPEPPSPAGHHAVTDGYSVGSFMRQPVTFTGPTPPSPFGSSTSAHINIPMSPPRGIMPIVGVSGTAGFPPASPLFPRATAATLDSSGRQRIAPPSPSMPYMMTPQQPGSAGNSMYQAYNVSGFGSRSNEDGNWSGVANDRLYPSPQFNAGGMAMHYGGIPVNRPSNTGRTYSFDETVLSSTALELDPTNPAYSPYNTSQTSPGGTLFAQPSWMYGGHPDMYNQSGSPLQPRHQNQVPMYAGMPGGSIRPVGPYGQFYPTTSPGPPIQTTTSNKGPDGANLFIFHIPNHFTNIDMYQLFCPYGNLLSVRIMVEKDTGRSRGFGFVSYDAPESAALAIKELNGFAIGNKRLKVQHKQIRSRDSHDRDSPDDCFLNSSGDLSFPRTQFPSNLPPPGPTTNTGIWTKDHRSNSQDIGDYDSITKQQNHDSELVLNSTSKCPLDSKQIDNNGTEEISPLTTMSQMQNALPDISGQGSSN